MLAVAVAVAPAFAGGVSVGKFYTEIAQAKRLVSVDAASAEASLRSAGFNLPSLALDKSLTEGDTTAISSVIGLTVTTHRPSQLISEAQVNTFMSIFGAQISASKTGSVNPFQLNDLPPQSGNGKGKKKGHHKSTSEPI